MPWLGAFQHIVPMMTRSHRRSLARNVHEHAVAPYAPSAGIAAAAAAAAADRY